jgi:omega-amidase
MKVALIQTELIWEQAEDNRTRLSEKIEAIGQPVDIIVLPEMFTTGFTMNPVAVAESIDGPTVSWMKLTAEKSGSAICGSIIISEEGHFYNRLLFVLPSGAVYQYDKRHLFTLAGEDQIYTAGKNKLIVEYKGFRICPLVCYDLRFPVFSRNLEDYDLLLYVANWPEPRINAWDALLRARAMENMSFVVGVNRVGSDKNGHQYPGHSAAVDYLGNYIIEPLGGEGVFIAHLDRDAMIEARQKFGFLNDRDHFTVT